MDHAANAWELFESIPEMVVVVGGGDVILYANKHCNAIVGWEPAELVGRPLGVILPDRPNAEHAGHGTALHRAGHEVPVEIALSPLSGDQGATVATVRDATE
ncbi:MAG: PAS domain S-box protein, partial [Ilumatobacteraceae bacterium]